MEAYFYFPLTSSRRDAEKREKERVRSNSKK
jgi:hypothetical protein